MLIQELSTGDLPLQLSTLRRLVIILSYQHNFSWTRYYSIDLILSIIKWHLIRASTFYLFESAVSSYQALKSHKNIHTFTVE